jgi:perosamine synthetase
MSGPPTPILHSRPTLGDEEVRAVTAVVGSGQVAQGPRVEAFERALASVMGRRGGVAVSSGTAALEVALLALGIGRGDEVVLPSYVCAAPWLAVTRVGAAPRIVDIDPASYALDPAAVKAALSSRTRAIIVPHLFGLPADLTALQDLGVPLIEDCAQTLCATERGRQVGTVGVLSVCSFYATKFLCAGEGGMVLADDPALLDKAHALREYDERPVLRQDAFNYKMTDLQAALGESQVARLGEFVSRRAAIARAYEAALAPLGLQPPAVPEGRTHVYYRYVMRLSGEASLDDVLARLERRGVHCRRPVFRPLHHYVDLAGCPASEEAHARAISLPIYPSLTDRQVTEVIRALQEALSA